jgi:hypothetical protein
MCNVVYVHVSIKGYHMHLTPNPYGDSPWLPITANIPGLELHRQRGLLNFVNILKELCRGLTRATYILCIERRRASAAQKRRSAARRN